jgi:uncharacterized damage-inducible protein DinB
MERQSGSEPADNALLASVRAILATTAGRWQRLTETIPEEQLNQQPAEGEWSASQCLLHLFETERYVFPVRVRMFLAGEDIVAFDPDAQAMPTALHPAALAAEFVELRAASLALLDTLETPDLARTAHHSELGVVTLREMLNQWAAHDLNHTIQAERALMQPFIAGCGPWRSNYEDHDLERR